MMNEGSAHIEVSGIAPEEPNVEISKFAGLLLEQDLSAASYESILTHIALMDRAQLPSFYKFLAKAFQLIDNTLHPRLTETEELRKIAQGQQVTESKAIITGDEWLAELLQVVPSPRAQGVPYPTDDSEIVSSVRTALSRAIAKQEAKQLAPKNSKTAMMLTRRSFLGLLAGGSALALLKSFERAKSHIDAFTSFSETDVSPEINDYIEDSELLDESFVKANFVDKLIRASDEESAKYTSESSELRAVYSDLFLPITMIILDVSARPKPFITDLISQFVAEIDLVASELQMRPVEVIHMMRTGFQNVSDRYKQGSYRRDLKTRKLQLALGAINAVNSDVGSKVSQVFADPSSGFSIPRGIVSMLHPEFPTTHYEAIRLRGPVTAGIADLEQQIYGVAIDDTLTQGQEPSWLLAEMKNDFLQLNEAYLKLNKAREDAFVWCEEINRNFRSELAVLFKDTASSDSWSAILSSCGISAEAISPEQLINPTIFFSETFQHDLDYWNRTRGDVEQPCKQYLEIASVHYYGDSSHGFMQFISDQLLLSNFPEVLHVFKNKLDGSSDLNSSLEALLEHRNTILSLRQEVDELDAKCTQHSMSLEKRADAQVHLISRASKYFLNQAQVLLKPFFEKYEGKIATSAEERLSYFPTDASRTPDGTELLPDPLTLYIANAIREIAPTPIMVSANSAESFARSVVADLPYAPTETVEALTRFIEDGVTFIDALFFNGQAKFFPIIAANWLCALQKNDMRLAFKKVEVVNVGAMVNVLDDPEYSVGDYDRKLYNFFDTQRQEYLRLFGDHYSSLVRAADNHEEYLSSKSYVIF